MSHPEILILFFLIAMIYASVGFGGGSSYLAVLAIFEFPIPQMRMIALFCNIIVVTGGTIAFIRHRQVIWKKVLPLILASMPFAYLGARMRISADVFFTLLGFSLLLAAVLLWIQNGNSNKTPHRYNMMKDAAYGGGIGFLSGMVGIGGGIFLSPLLNLSRWDTSKHIAATASFFILANSLSGMAGQLSAKAPVNGIQLLLLGGAVLLGGLAGTYLGIRKFNPVVVRRLTALLVFFAGMEVLIKHFSI